MLINSFKLSIRFTNYFTVIFSFIGLVVWTVELVCEKVDDFFKNIFRR